MTELFELIGILDINQEDKKGEETEDNKEEKILELNKMLKDQKKGNLIAVKIIVKINDINENTIIKTMIVQIDMIKVKDSKEMIVGMTDISERMRDIKKKKIDMTEEKIDTKNMKTKNKNMKKRVKIMKKKAKLKCQKIQTIDLKYIYVSLLILTVDNERKLKN